MVNLICAPQDLLRELILIVISMREIAPGSAEMLKNETSVLQLVQSHVEDERKCIKELASLAMELYSYNTTDTSINCLEG